MEQKNDPSAIPSPKITRQDPNMIPISEDTMTTFKQDFRVIPLFEKKIHEFTRKKHYSLETNEFLKQRWRRFSDKTGPRHGPIQFPSVRDFHFYLGDARYIPSQSLSSHASFRMQLSPGPGFDAKGGRPVPDDMLMKRGERRKDQPGRKREAGKGGKGEVTVGKK